jgi:hypothetical protein
MKQMLLTMAALLLSSVFALATAAARPPSAQAGQASQTVSGTLTAKDGKFFLTDSATGITVEVRGEGLQKHAGQKVTATGVVAAGAAGSPQVLTVSSISRASAAVGGKAAAAGVKAGLSKAAVVGIVGGATAASVGTLYATDVIGGEEEPVSRR